MNPGVKIILYSVVFTLVAPGCVTGVFPWLLLSAGLPVVDPGPWRFAGLLPLVSGTGVYGWTVIDFIATGRGTPAPISPPTTLVNRGLYRVTRNPMYGGILLVILGETVWFGSTALLVYWALAWGCFHLFVVDYEEPTLERSFGEAYRQYRRRVPRWFPGRKQHDK